MLHTILSVQHVARYGKEQVPGLNGSRVNRISVRKSLAIEFTCGRDKLRDSRERQLHEVFPAAALAASQSYPASRRTCCATCTSSKGIGPLRVTCAFSWPLPAIITMSPGLAL